MVPPLIWLTKDEGFIIAGFELAKEATDPSVILADKHNHLIKTTSKKTPLPSATLYVSFLS